MSVGPPLPTHIGRDLDLKYPTHRRILLFAAAMVLIIGGQQLLIGTDFIQAVIHAVGAGAFSFGTWAIGRELDPDHDLSAFIGAVLTTLALLYLPLPWVFAVGAIGLLLRVVNWTYGLPPLWSDYLAPLLVTAIAIALDGLWPLGVVVTLGFALNALLPRPQRLFGFVFTAVMLIVTILVSQLTPRTTIAVGPDLLHLALVVIAIVLYLVAIFMGRKSFASTGDMTGEPLIPARIQAGRGLALLAGLALLIVYGSTGFIALLPVWAAMLGIGLRFVLRRG